MPYLFLGPWSDRSRDPSLYRDVCCCVAQTEVRHLANHEQRTQRFPLLESPMNFAINGLTDIGRGRDENQDAVDWYAAPQQQFGYLLVADGMGGYAGGATASRLAAETIGDRLKLLPYDPAFSAGTNEQLLRQTLESALGEAHQRILDEKTRYPQLAQMGTTVVVAALWQHIAVVAHIGDSRAYLWREQQLTQITRDHSLLQELIDSNALTPDEAARSGQRNVLTRALGVGGELAADFCCVPLAGDALLLLCSDGLTGKVSDSGLANELAQHLPGLESCYRLVHMANDAGGQDNISVAIAEIFA
jgi:serine/threonine protein phosphatase PrpC